MCLLVNYIGLPVQWQEVTRFNSAMDGLAYVCSHHDKSTRSVCVRCFVHSHRSSFSSNYHLTFDERVSIQMSKINVDFPVWVIHDSLVELHFDRDVMEEDHVQETILVGDVLREA